MFPMRWRIFFNGNYERNWEIEQTGRKDYQWSYDYWLWQSGVNIIKGEWKIVCFFIPSFSILLCPRPLCQGLPYGVSLRLPLDTLCLIHTISVGLYILFKVSSFWRQFEDNAHSSLILWAFSGALGFGSRLELFVKSWEALNKRLPVFLFKKSDYTWLHC